MNKFEGAGHEQEFCKYRFVACGRGLKWLRVDE